jgi:chorismate dehydratase
VSTLPRLGVPSAFYARPLTVHLAERDMFARQVDVPAQHAVRLREHELEAAFLTPIDFARDSSEYRIVPGVGVSSASATGTISLLFHDDIQTIHTVAIDPSSSSEIVLAKIILAEEYELEPKFKPFAGPADSALAQADAVLLVGDASLREISTHPNRIDLVEGWNVLTGLPYVHGFWCGGEEALNAEEVQWLLQGAYSGCASLDTIASDLPHGAFPSFSHSDMSDYLHAFSYDLNEDDLDGLKEFLRYAFYHGVTPDVSGLRFYPLPGAPRPPMPSLS